MKWFDKIMKYNQWIVLGSMLFGYLAFLVLTPEASIENTITDWQTWVHTIFVVYLNIMTVSLSLDTATEHGLNLEEFELADDLNNKLIKKYNASKKEFRAYVKALNEHELRSMQEDFLYNHGAESEDDLSPKLRRLYKKLKPIRHDIYGYNLALFYEITKNGEVKYKSSIAKNEGKRKKQISKGIMGIVFSAMSVNMALTVSNLSSALVSLVVILSGLFITYFMIYTPQLNKFKKEIPKKVLGKKILMDSFEENRLPNEKSTQ